MASCPETCASRRDSSGRETGSDICLRFGVRSYLHHFYNECSSSTRDRDPEDQGSVQGQRSARPWSSATWKVTLALGALLLGAGATLSVRLSGSHRIESFGEGELRFVDAAAVRHNQALSAGVAAGAALACLGVALALTGACLWLLPPPGKLPLNAESGEGEGERRRRREGGGGGEPWAAVTRAPGPRLEGKVPVTLSKVEGVQPAPPTPHEHF